MNVTQVQPLPSLPIADDPRISQQKERIAVLERELREATRPADAARLAALTDTLAQVLEWLDGMVETAEDQRLGMFCDRLAAQIRETLYGSST